MAQLLRSTVTLILLLTTGALCASTKTLIWSDEFNYTGLPDETKWGYDVGGSGWGNNELQHYTEKRSENARVENGNLIIEARKEPFNGNQYTSARLVTKGKGDWLYGRIEVRAILPEGKGLWPAIWMLPTDWTYGTWPKSGEIDIMENVGYDADRIHFTVHTESYNHTLGTQKSNAIIIDSSSTRFHVYAAEWFSDHIDFFVDDKPAFSFLNENTGSKAWPFDMRFHLLLNIAVGGNWGGIQGIDDAAFPQKMVFDYVRVYSLVTPSDSFTLAIDTFGRGSVRISPKADKYDSGTVVTIIAQPSPGYVLYRYQGNLSSRKDSTTVVMNKNIKATAIFNPEGEMIINGDFTSGNAFWLPVGNFGGTGEGTIVNGEYRVFVKNAGTEDWHIQFNQEGILLEKDVRYTLVFDAYAESLRTISAAVNMSLTPWTSYKKETFSLTTQKTKYTCTFTMSNSTDTNARVEFDCGLQAATIFLDNVSLRRVDEMGHKAGIVKNNVKHELKIGYTRHTNVLYVSNLNVSGSMRLLTITGQTIETSIQPIAVQDKYVICKLSTKLSPGIYILQNYSSSINALYRFTVN